MGTGEERGLKAERRRWQIDDGIDRAWRGIYKAGIT